MSQPFDIFRRLQDYELLPPPEVVAGLRNALNIDLNSAITPGLEKINGSGDQNISHDHSGGFMERLGQLEIEPPAFIRASIENRIREKNSLKRPFLKTVSLYPYRSIAACLILAVGVWIIYRANHSAKHVSLVVTNKTNLTLAKNHLPGTPDQDGAGQGSGNKDSASEKKMAMNAASSEDTNTDKTNGSTGSKTVKIKPFTSFSIQGQGIPVVDNDLLVTFASFSYEEIPAFLTGTETRDLKIHVDQYTNVVISKAMAATMKEMYQIKSGGKPTRKARKTRERLEDWKKKDLEHFDKASGNNPLDPIDLAKFIFK